MFQLGLQREPSGTALATNRYLRTYLPEDGKIAIPASYRQLRHSALIGGGKEKLFSLLLTYIHTPSCRSSRNINIFKSHVQALHRTPQTDRFKVPWKKKISKLQAIYPKYIIDPDRSSLSCRTESANMNSPHNMICTRLTCPKENRT